MRMAVEERRVEESVEQVVNGYCCEGGMGNFSVLSVIIIFDHFPLIQVLLRLFMVEEIIDSGEWGRLLTK